ncbi:outer membrane protein [Bradyrhizobium erythrophlei]|jgi:outer membrane immunogenic protein|uniref:Outer membrane immunogenic protein n=1 Tax=Bradyrhizobium erythrophlei TaxID=1437360 RepID=A0A1M5QXP4_9BRAD|nr:outer membrane immunogenic protein [Bradyrhizobium erythrophlei]
MIRSKFVAALALVTLGAGAASAADLAPFPYAKAPPLAYAVYDWSGFYVGGHIGGSWSNQVWTNTANTTLFGDLVPREGFGQHGAGVFGGAQIGYNWQASNYVAGLEGTISGLDNSGTLSNTVFGARDDVFSWHNNWMATITGRAGITANNNLFYVKGGYAGVNSHLAVSDVVPPAIGSGSDNHWHNGWTVGAGWEYGITQNWIFGLEYDYAAFGTRAYQLGTNFGVYSFDVKPRDIQSAVARVSYKFNGPLVAKY